MRKGFGITTGDTATTVLKGDGWYPDLEVAEFLRLYRLPAEYAEALIADHLNLARIWVAGELRNWRIEQEIVKGVAKIDDIALQGIERGALLVYKRAVFCRAKGLLLPQFATIERRPEANNDAKEAPEAAESFFAQAEDAVATLIGRTFITVGSL